MQDLIEQIEDLQIRLNKNLVFLDLDKKKNELKSLEAQMSQPNFWNDNQTASRVSKESAGIKSEIDDWEKIGREVKDLLEITQLDSKDSDVNLRVEVESGLSELTQRFEKMEFLILMNGKYDKLDAIVSIYSGAGGDDAQDWAEILLKMYLNYAEKKDFKVSILDQSRGSVAGIKNVTFEVSGRFAYGYLKAEDGVHRLVRISPFDADKARHTSFAMVQVLPQIEELDDKELKIEDKDIRIDTFLSSGPGGQGVQTTYSGVRIVHLPTGIMANCQETRSQLQNKEKAFKVLYSKLHQYYQSKQEEEREKLRGEFKEAAWGNQARSYVFHPYQLVKDHRTNFETSDVESVLNGELDKFIEEYLRKN
ncbi:MAG: peptide chain release factor 2 [Patescibacteria group bacterium]